MGLLAATLVLTAGCAGTERRDPETQLIDAFIREGKSVELKDERQREVWVIDPTHRFSERGCPIARIRKWEDDVKVEDKDVEICSDRDRRMK
jgi:hypothetical protein